MRLTTQQRIHSLERDVEVLQGTMKMLHKLLRQQREMIHEYITVKVRNPANEVKGRNGTVHPVDAVYTFVCKKRFDKLEKDLRKVLKSTEGPPLAEKVG